MGKRVNNSHKRRMEKHSGFYFAGCAVGTCRRKVDDAPTYTEKRRMACVADYSGDNKAWLILVMHERRSQWPATNKALIEAGFTYRGYRR
ncbi:MAG: hypothetical protein ABUJ92_00590 [Desulfobacterales bacterium]